MNWDGKQFVIDEVETSERLERNQFGTKSGQTSLLHHLFRLGNMATQRKRLSQFHSTRVTATQSKNEISGTIQSADPEPELQSLAKALKGNWSTTYEFAPRWHLTDPEAPALVKRTGGRRIRFDRGRARACSL